MAACVYILCNRKHGTLYTGVTTDICARMVQHKQGLGSKFCAEHGVDKLVYVESTELVIDAIAREKAIKKWRRAWKVELIERSNSDWRDLFFDLNR